MDKLEIYFSIVDYLICYLVPFIIYFKFGFKSGIIYITCNIVFMLSRIGTKLREIKSMV